jgi:hypothetical protein
MNRPILNFSEALNTNSSDLKDSFPGIDHSRLNPLNTRKPVRQRQGGITNIFPIKLFSMLKDIELNESCSDIVKWSENGNAFIIVKPKEFTKFLLPIYFRTAKLSSFQRQLNAYGFTKFNLYACQDDFHVYYHRFFHRDHADHVKLVCRRDVMQPNYTVQRGRQKKRLFEGESIRQHLPCKVNKHIQSIAPFPFDLASYNNIHSLNFRLVSETTNRLNGFVLRDLVLDQAAEDVWEHDATFSRKMIALFKEWDPISELLRNDDDLGKVDSVSAKHFQKSTTTLNYNSEDEKNRVIEELTDLEIMNIEARVKVWNPNPIPDQELNTAEDADSERKSFSSDEWDAIVGLERNISHKYSNTAIFQEFLDLTSGTVITNDSFEVTLCQEFPQMI